MPVSSEVVSEASQSISQVCCKFDMCSEECKADAIALAAVQVSIEEVEAQSDPVSELHEEILMLKEMEEHVGAVVDGVPVVEPAEWSAEEELERVRQLFEPGMQFKGTIAIPGWNPESPTDPEEDIPEERQEYTLCIVMVRVEHEKPVIYARHAAYGDSQSCTVQLDPASARGEGVKLSYYDCETQCSGTVEPMTGRLRGVVRQLIHGDAGFYHPSSDVMNTFELFPSIPQSVAPRYGLLALKSTERARLVAAWSRSCLNVPAATVISDESCFQENVREAIGRVPWEQVFQDAAAAAEDLCAKLRGQGRLMELLEIQKKATRNEELACKTEAFPRALAHKLADEALTQLQCVFRCWASFTLASGDEDRHRKCLNLSLTTLAKTVDRLEKAYGTLHHAMESAERRVARDTLESWCHSGDGETLCAICMTCLEEDEVGLVLPCDHKFHRDCCTQWLHENASCPNCRQPMTDM